MAPVVERAPIDAALNTHANPDHCFGNELLPTATEIYASAASAAEMRQLSPELLHALKSAPGMPPDLADFVDARLRALRLLQHHLPRPVADLQRRHGVERG